MHSSTTLATILLAASAASPAIAAPLNARIGIIKFPNTDIIDHGPEIAPEFPLFHGEAPIVDRRAITLPPTFDHGPARITPDLLQSLGITRRELDELTAREPGLLDLLKPLGTGLLGGAAVPLINHFLGGGSSDASSRSFTIPKTFDIGPERISPDLIKALSERSITLPPTFDHGPETITPDLLQSLGITRRSILGSLLGATEDSLGTVVKTAAAGGLASGAVAAAGGALEHLFGDDKASSKRELEERINFGPIEKGIIGTVTSLGVSSAASDLLGKVFGNSGSSSRRELEERLNLGPIEKGLIGTVTSLGVSSAASDLLGKVFGNSNSRRDVTPEQALAAIILSGRSFNELD
ncbi:hypothetical protein FA95DRAFT_1602049 [Auriscalpium vulgare]|uniref:Uncharacterized protein n=1 Tax=Auriscalpium vulgare TaxID=40419 RepID=A0ACB8S884_9AGAM|nr:hypothetical protein FA95DRAFT_1602049 [Auriscalpium vulgare]